MSGDTRLRCIVCGGQHRPTSPMYCDEAGMDREIARMGNRLWNQITGAVTATEGLNQKEKSS